MTREIYRNSRQYGLEKIARARANIRIGFLPIENQGAIRYWREYLAWCRNDYYKRQRLA